MLEIEQNASSRLIDLCVDFISKKDAAYLCREDTIVYFASSTGNPDDAKWMLLKISEVVRIIRATKLPAEFQSKLKPSHVIAACQELDRVYDYGVKSSEEVADNVFNYLTESGRSIYEEIMDFIAIEYRRLAYYAFSSTPVLEMFHAIVGKLKLELPKKREITRIMKESFAKLGYKYRFGVNPMVIKGEKISGFLLGGHKIKEIKELSNHHRRMIEKAAYKSVKDN